MILCQDILMQHIYMTYMTTLSAKNTSLICTGRLLVYSKTSSCNISCLQQDFQLQYILFTARLPVAIHSFIKSLPVAIHLIYNKTSSCNTSLGHLWDDSKLQHMSTVTYEPLYAKRVLRVILIKKLIFLFSE